MKKMKELKDFYIKFKNQVFGNLIFQTSINNLINALVCKEVFTVVLALSFPLIVSLLLKEDAFRQLPLGAVQFVIINLLAVYLITALLNKVRPFEHFALLVVAAGVVPLVWIIVYSATFHILHNYSSVLNYLGAIWLFLFCYSVNCFSIIISNKYILFTTKIIYSTVLFVLSLPAIAYYIYVKLYQREFDDFVMMTVLQTNFAEAKSYLLTQLSYAQIISLGVFLLILFIGLLEVIFRIETIKHVKKTPDFDEVARKKRIHYFVKSLLLVMVTGIIFFKHHYALFPFEAFYSLQSTDSGLLKIFSDLNKNINKNSSHIKIVDLQGDIDKGTIILVIGESANSDFMSAFNPKMKENTTPWELKMRNSGKFVFFDHAYSNYPLTNLSLSFALTNSNQYNNIELNKAVSILNIAKKAGYRTYYYSMQQKSSIYDAGVSIIANQADFVEFICEDSKGYDEKIINSLRNILPDKKNFVILHLRGSHFVYSERYPESFVKGKNLLFSDSNRDYKFSILYTDCLLKEIFEYANKHLNLQTMVYFSDHGEDMNYTHLPNYFTFSMVHIPLWVYLSPEVSLHNPDILQNLRRHEKSIFTNDLVFDTVHGLLRCKSNYYNCYYDLTSANYNITLKNAKTMHGKISIMDDPIWRK